MPHTANPPSLFFASGFSSRFFLLKGGAVCQFTLVIHGCFLSDEGHVGCGGSFYRAAENTVVGIGCAGERLPGPPANV